jgi:hypothetical protein
MANHLYSNPLDQRTAVNRRRLLRGLGLMTASLTSGIWKTSTAFGADNRSLGAKHFIAIFSSNGTVPSAFFPPGNAAEAPLELGAILSPLAKHKSKMLVLKGLDYRSTVENKLGTFKDGVDNEGSIYDLKPGGPHMKGPGAFLTGGSLMHGPFGGSGGPAGWADRISLDQYLAQNLAPKTKFPSLEFGVRVSGQEPLTCISYAGAKQPNIPVLDPFIMFARLFKDVGINDEELAKKLAERKSILDYLKDDFSTLKTRLSADDKIRLDAHLTGIRALEQQLSTSGALTCKIPEMPSPFDPNVPERFAVTGRLQTDLMVLAHTCGLTTISTFMWANANSWQTYPWLDINDEHHNLSHAGDNDTAQIDKLIKINRWHSEQVGYLMDKLAEVPEADGKNLLDNTLLLWGNELGAGNTHTYHDIPFVLAGGAGNYFKMGRSLTYKNQPHNNLLVSIANAMGAVNLKTFGIEGVCTGPLERLVA